MVGVGVVWILHITQTESMKLTVWEGTEAVETVTRLRLIPSVLEEGIDLVAVDENGEVKPAGYLLRISEEGVYFYPGVGEDHGFFTDDDYLGELAIVEGEI